MTNSALDFADAVARAFALGSPLGTLEPIQAASFETWKLRTTNSQYLVKRLWREEHPEQRVEIEFAMRYEEKAMAAGIRTSIPVRSPGPLFYWAAEVGSHGTFRVYEWPEHRKLLPTDDITSWVATTMSTLHRLEPITEATHRPKWRWLGVHAPEVWTEWLSRGEAMGRPWVPVTQAQLADVLDLSDRIVAAFGDAPDLVVSHSDVGPYNVLVTKDGPALIDWDNASPTKASSEMGRVIEVFASGEIAGMRNLWDAYKQADGIAQSEPQDLFIGLLTQHLSNVTERIMVSLGDEPPATWMNEQDINETIDAQLQSLPGRVDFLSQLGEAVLCGAGTHGGPEG